MERLEPVLKQKFWILLGMGILMTVVGWWMDTGTMAATIKTRETEIKAAEGKIPTGEIPNAEWSNGLSALNVQQDLAVKSATRVLWERQRARMTWPETVAEFAWKTGYRKDIALAGRENYRTDYENDWRRVWETLRPFNRVDGTGIVDFGLGKLPRKVWGELAPSPDEMWDAQEDLWLLEGLLQLIAEVNGGANSTRLDAHIHVIEKLTLHGGQPAGQRALPSAATGSSSGGGAMDTSSFSGGFGSGSGGGGGGGAAAAASADFDVKEEFGDDGSGAAGQGAAMSSFGSAGALSGGGSTATKSRRYIDDGDALPFKTRGFYMTLIMDHRKIPNLISELSASEKSAWPIEIIRVQVVRLNEDDLEGRGGGGGGFSPGSGSSSESFGGSSGGNQLSGFTENSSGSSFGGTSSPSFSVEGGSSGGGAATAQGASALAALTNAVQDPNMSRVAICGIITLYKEVAAEVVVAPPASPQPAATPAAAVETQPNAEAAPATEAAADGDSKPTTEGDSKPADPAEGEPTTTAPAAEGSSKPAEDAPKSDEKPAASDPTKPADAP